MTLLQDIVPVDPAQIAGFLADGYVGAIAVGRAEAGPRALCHRSMIASASDVSVRDRINGLIKRRLPFQPLAPVCLREDLSRYFEEPETEISLDFMTTAVRVTELTRRCAPAVVHADGTARVQVLDERRAPLMAQILQMYRQRSGVGILINTSLNGPGEPIVNSASQAFAAYLELDLDFLVLDRFLISSRLC